MRSPRPGPCPFCSSPNVVRSGDNLVCNGCGSVIVRTRGVDGTPVYLRDHSLEKYRRSHESPPQWPMRMAERAALVLWVLFMVGLMWMWSH